MTPKPDPAKRRGFTVLAPMPGQLTPEQEKWPVVPLAESGRPSLPNELKGLQELTPEQQDLLVKAYLELGQPLTEGWLGARRSTSEVQVQVVSADRPPEAA